MTRFDRATTAIALGWLLSRNRSQPATSCAGTPPLQTALYTTVALVQRTLGHANIATTSQYLHARPGDSSGRYLAE